MTTAIRNPIETGSVPTKDGGTSPARSTTLHSRRRTTLSGLVAVVIALVGTACGGDDSEADATTSDAAANNEVVMQDISFQPGEITVEVGTEVTWTNEDGVPHTTTSEDTVWDSGNLSSGESFSHTFDRPGTYAYVCEIHPTMQATVTVEG